MPTKKAKLRSYHFSLGDSSNGPVGFCARVNAASKKEAVAYLREVIGIEVEVFRHMLESGEYVAVYFNPDKITEDDIDEVEDAD